MRATLEFRKRRREGNPVKLLSDARLCVMPPMAENEWA
jgi:hypothetical protein